MEDKVSIVLSTYNGEKYIKQQLDSILSGNWKNILVEVSDDCSTDATVEIVKEYCKRYEGKVKLHINEKNLGYTKNFLSAITRSESEYIMLCDQDDLWLPDKVEKTLHRMKEVEQKDKPALVFTDAWLYNGTSGERMGRFHANSHLDTEKVDISHLLMENKCIGCTTMINRETLKFITKLPEHIRVHDWWLVLICSCFGTVTYLDEPTLDYRQHANNMIGGTSFMQYFKNRFMKLFDQRKAVIACCEQAKDFEKLYSSQLSDSQRIVLHQFATLYDCGWITRRIRCIRYGFWKSGFVRNAGLFLIL